MGETRRKFDADFREGAVRLVRETGKPIAQVARDLGINEGTLGNWVNVDKRRRGAGNGVLDEDERAELARTSQATRGAASPRRALGHPGAITTRSGTQPKQLPDSRAADQIGSARGQQPDDNQSTRRGRPTTAVRRPWHDLAMPEQVTLRLVSEDDLPLLRTLTQDPQATGEFEQYGWYAPRLFQRGWQENGLISADGGNLMVVRGDDVLGAVSWRRHDTAPASSCWTLGIGLFPQARGHGYGTQAHRLIVRYLFEHTTIHRIEAATETGNIAEQKALERAGFTREGVLRGIRWRGGAWRDEVLYSILRSDPPA